MARTPKIQPVVPILEDPVEVEEVISDPEVVPDPPAPKRFEFPIKLGFGPPPGRTLVYIGDIQDSEGSYCWYTLSNDRDNPSRYPIPDNSLTGYLTDLRIVPKVYKGKWGYKVYITIAADKEYTLRSGVESEFSTRVVCSLARVDDFNEPICISVSKGSSDKVIFGHVTIAKTGDGIWVRNEEIPERTSSLIFEIQRRLGVEVQSGESIKAYIAQQDESRR